MEKPAAMRAGIGWQGKHTNLVSRAHGSWLFLGEVFTALELPPDAAETDHCGSCRACLDVCPTNAFPAPYRIDARRCISYLTIEHKGHIDREFRGAMGNRIYGCDDCLAVCPWNKFAAQTREYRRIDGAAKVGAHRTSMLQDLERGRPLELDALLTAVQEMGQIASVETPYIDTVLALVQQMGEVAGVYPVFPTMASAPQATALSPA